MVQIIEGKPSLASKLWGSIGHGAQSGLQTGMNYAMQLGLKRTEQNADLQSAIQKEMAKQKIKQLVGSQEEQELSSLFGGNNLKNQEAAQEPESLYSSLTKPSEKEQKLEKISDLPIEKQAILAHKYPEVYKTQLAKEKEGKERSEIESSFGRLEELAPYTGLGFKSAYAATIPGTEARQKRQEMDSLGFWVADKVYSHFNKGQMAEVKFDYIKDKLAPKSGLWQTEYKARVNAMKRIMGLSPDAPKAQVQKIINQETKKIESLSKQKRTLDELSDEYLR